jgi:glucose-6-phosphate isomerase
MKAETFAALERLRAHRAEMGNPHLRDLFAADPDRFSRFSTTFGDLTLDYSKNRIVPETVPLLLALADRAGVAELRDAMFAGERINRTEDRAVLHTVLRALPDADIRVDGENVVPAVHSVLDAFCAFADQIRSGGIRGVAEDRFTDVVNIGIGGSDLGPAMAAAALIPYRGDGPKLHFVSNVDGAHLADTLAGLEAERTLFLVASKTFTTSETMTNAGSARSWLAYRLGEEAVPGHFAAISTNLGKVAEFGIRSDRVFGFWDWVGGRYSVWSAIGLPVAISIGADNFRAFLAGARRMDEHFRTAPMAENMPVLMGLLGSGTATSGISAPTRCSPTTSGSPASPRTCSSSTWNRTASAPLATRAWWNTAQARWSGASRARTGSTPSSSSCTKGPRSCRRTSSLRRRAHEDMGDHHAKLVANCFAQTEALAFGKTEDEVRAELAEAGMTSEALQQLVLHKVFPGNRPTNTLIYRRLDPETLGMLIALYEHKVFVQGAVWNINSFDQWGVELGKALATRLLPVVRDGAASNSLDASTRGLVEQYRQLRGH